MQTLSNDAQRVLGRLELLPNATPTPSSTSSTPSSIRAPSTLTTDSGTPLKPSPQRPTRCFVRVAPPSAFNQPIIGPKPHPSLVPAGEIDVVRTGSGERVLSIPQFESHEGRRRTPALCQYDDVFDGSDDGAVYTAVGAPLIELALNGESSCAFAYGQTGSGKTHNLWRIILPAMAEALHAAGARVEVAAAQLYMDRLEDLLQPIHGLGQGERSSTASPASHLGADRCAGSTPGSAFGSPSSSRPDGSGPSSSRPTRRPPSSGRARRCELFSTSTPSGSSVASSPAMGSTPGSGSASALASPLSCRSGHLGGGSRSGGRSSSAGPSAVKPADLLQDGLHWVRCDSAAHMCSILAGASGRLRTAATRINANSSRSHSFVHVRVWPPAGENGVCPSPVRGREGRNVPRLLASGYSLLAAGCWCLGN